MWGYKKALIILYQFKFYDAQMHTRTIESYTTVLEQDTTVFITINYMEL